MTKPYALGENAKKEGVCRWGKEAPSRGQLSGRAWRGAKRSKHALGRQMFQLIRAYEAGLCVLQNNCLQYLLSSRTRSHLYVLTLCYHLVQCFTSPMCPTSWTRFRQTDWQECHLHANWWELIHRDLWVWNVMGRGSSEPTKVTSGTGSRAPYWFPIHHHYAWQLQTEQNSNHENRFSVRMHEES